MKLGTDVKPPVLIKQVDPKFPHGTKKEGLQREVLLAIVVDESGLPQNIHVDPSQNSSDELAQKLDDSAIKAVKQWRFRPALYENKAVAVELKVAVNFQVVPR